METDIEYLRCSPVKILTPSHKGLKVIFDQRFARRAYVRIGQVAFGISFEGSFHSEQPRLSRNT